MQMGSQGYIRDAELVWTMRKVGMDRIYWRNE